MDETPLRLTQYARGGGCAAKLKLRDLVNVMQGVQPPHIDNLEQRVLVGSDYADDAGVVRLIADPVDSKRGLAMTTDIIGPLVDDPATFGAIAATNAISDIYAMGGVPTYALNLMFFPDDQLPLTVMRDIMGGGADKAAEAGVPIVGGHTVCNDHVKYGLAVVGEVALPTVLSNRGGRDGQLLVLTKALGTGVISSAIRRGDEDKEAAKAAIASMLLLNGQALAIGRQHGISACTDVTGFGLFGHLRNILNGSDLAARVFIDDLPLLPGALALAEADQFPGGSRATLSFVEPLLDRSRLDGSASTNARVALAADAQTSGGLLMCLDADQVPSALAALSASGHAAACVGELRAPQEGLASGQMRLCHKP